MYRTLYVFNCNFNENKSMYEVFIKLRERKDTGNCKRKHWITLCGEPNWEEAMELNNTECGMNEYIKLS